MPSGNNCTHKRRNCTCYHLCNLLLMQLFPNCTPIHVVTYANGCSSLYVYYRYIIEYSFMAQNLPTILLFLIPLVDVDYNSTTCALTFPAGSGPGTTRSCSIPIFDDALVEANEAISVSGSTATTVLPFTTTVIITDTDSKPIYYTTLFCSCMYLHVSLDFHTLIYLVDNL